MTTGNSSNVSQSGATLTASFGEATGGSILEAGFRYGTSPGSLSRTAYYNEGGLAVPSGSFSVSLSALEAGTTYYYQAFVQIDSDEFAGSVRSFTTSSSAGPGGSDPAAFAASYLSCYEMPATTVSLSAGTTYHSRVSERYGTTQAYIFNPASSTQRVVTHTFSDGSRVKRNYSMLFDKSKRCALWCAFAMHASEYADNGVGRNDSWDYDPAIPADWQANLSSAYASYTRGHQVASGDRQTSTAQNKQTFYYSNMTPQASSLNSGQWGSLESAVQGLGETQVSGRDTLYVVTGPLFEAGFRTTTDASGASCAVPTRYWKCIMKCSFDSSGNIISAVGAGYWFTHDGTNAPRQTTTIDAIEAMTGFDLFANVPTAIQESAESSSYRFF